MLASLFVKVDQACVALASLAVDGAVGVRLMRADLVQAIEMVLRNTSNEDELLISVLQVLMNLAFTSDAVASRVLTKEILKRLKILCVHRSPEVCANHSRVEICSTLDAIDSYH